MRSQPMFYREWFGGLIIAQTVYVGEYDPGFPWTWHINDGGDKGQWLGKDFKTEADAWRACLLYLEKKGVPIGK